MPKDKRAELVATTYILAKTRGWKVDGINPNPLWSFFDPDFAQTLWGHDALKNQHTLLDLLANFDEEEALRFLADSIK